LFKLSKQEIKRDIKNYNDYKILAVLQQTGSIKKLKKEMYTNHNLTTLQNRKGEEIRIRKDIVEVATNFYKELYKSNENSINKCIIELVNNDDDTSNIMLSEVRDIIQKLKINKSPGPDKIENELLKTFSEILVEPLTIIFNKILGNLETLLQ